MWFGLVCAALAFFLASVVFETWMVFAVIPIAALSHLMGAALTGIMTRQVSDSEQGELQGVLGAIGAVTSVISSVMMTGIFLQTGNRAAEFYFPGAPYLLAGVLTVAAALPLSVAVRRARQNQTLG